MTSNRPPLRRLLRDESGQSLGLIVCAMFVLLVVATLAIDVSQWEQKHHQAQVSADAAALAAANCLARGACSSATAAGDAGTTATTAANANQVPVKSISFDTTNKQVTVTTATAAPVTLAGLVNLHPTASATAVASYAVGNLPYSLFAENTTCGTGAGGNPLGLFVNATGGGTTTITGMFANGEFYNSNDSNSATWDGTVTSTCSGGAASQCKPNKVPYTQNCWETKNTTVNTVGNQLYPECAPEPGVSSQPSYLSTYCASAPSGPGPTCDYAPDNYWTTDSSKGGTGNRDLITGPPPSGEAYCVGTSGTSSSSPATSAVSCSSSSDGTAGSIYVSGLSGSGYEFAGPCIALSSGSTMSSSGTEPLVYGTADTKSSGASDVFLTGNGTDLNSPVFDPLGSVEFDNNNGNFTGFIEAMNIVVNSNNASVGNGPLGPNQPGGDSLIQ